MRNGILKAIELMSIMVW